MPLEDICVNTKIVHVKEEVDDQNMVSYDLYKEHNYHMKEDQKEIDLCKEDIHMKEQTEFNLYDEDIDVKEEVIQMNYDLYEDICVRDEVIQTEMCEGNDMYDANVNVNLILANYLCEDIHVKEEIMQKEYDCYEEAIVKTNAESEWSIQRTGVSEASMQENLYKKHTVNNELVIGRETLPLRDIANTAGETATREGLFKEHQLKDENENIHMQEDKHEAVHVKEEPDDVAYGVSEAATLEGLYEEHIVKDELVIGPEVLQPRHVADVRTASAWAARARKDEICHMVLSEQRVADHTCEPFTCDICHERFRTKYLMMKHIRLHTKESFDCAICPESFPSKSCLTAHLRVHKGEMPFTCEVCSKQFGRWYHLNKHMASCPMPYYQSQVLMKSPDTVDWNQDWKYHVDGLCRRLNGVIVALSKMAPMVPGDALEKVYFARFHSVMSYGALMWGNSEYANRVLVLQEEAIRILAGVAPDAPCKPLFVSQRILTHYSQYIFDLLLFVRNNIFQFRCTKKGRLRTVRRRTALSEKNPRVIGPNFYERLPFDLKEEPSDEEFMLRLYNILLEKPLFSVSEYMEQEFGRKWIKKRSYPAKKIRKFRRSKNKNSVTSKKVLGS